MVAQLYFKFFFKSKIIKKEKRIKEKYENDVSATSKY